MFWYLNYIVYYSINVCCNRAPPIETKCIYLKNDTQNWNFYVQLYYNLNVFFFLEDSSFFVCFKFRYNNLSSFTCMYRHCLRTSKSYIMPNYIDILVFKKFGINLNGFLYNVLICPFWHLIYNFVWTLTISLKFSPIVNIVKKCCSFAIFFHTEKA